MEPTGLVYVTITIGGILLTSPEAIPMEQCVSLQTTNPSTLCIEKEPDCGKHSGDDPCLGQAWQEEQVKKPAKKRTTSRRRIRRTHVTPVADIMRRAL